MDKNALVISKRLKFPWNDRIDKNIIAQPKINLQSFKVTPNLRGCRPEKKSYARCVLGNHHNLYIDKKVIKCRTR